jgi:hypothetical protein
LAGAAHETWFSPQTGARREGGLLFFVFCQSAQLGHSVKKLINPTTLVGMPIPI